jgi:hypothetical protein
MEIIMGQYFGSWSNKQDVIKDFCIDSKELDGAKVHIAWYGQGDYEGSAFVLFERDGQLYECHGSHCSCYGLEDQWGPEETTVDELEHRYVEGTWLSDYYDHGKEAKAALQRFVNRRRKMT